ncbi:MAG: YebC/PmpR family DNA-binding transcriptional regulator [Candidatus Andersenbacteria bacterium]
MSGHSKWHKIRHQKAAKDQKKSKEFGRMARDIKIAARTGRDPAKNASLRDAVERAKKANMPQANIDRLLRDRDDATLAEIPYEGFGPAGVGIIILARTDNPNRTVSEVRTAFKSHGFELGGAGSVQWKFGEDFSPRFPVSITDDDQIKLDALVVTLEELEDVDQVFTDAAR